MARTIFLLSRTQAPRVWPFRVHPCRCALGATGSHCADHRGVHGQLCSDHFQTTVVSSSHWQKVQVLDTDVYRHPCSCFPADPCRTTLQRIPSATQNPRGGASSPVVATRIEWLATPASCGTQGELAPKATQKKHPETLRVETGCGRDRWCVEWDAGHGTSL